MSNFLDKLAQQNSHLIDLTQTDGGEVHLARTIEVSEHGLHKRAHHAFDRIDQFIDMHQSAPSPDFWIMKEGKIVRNPEEAPHG